ncbi:bifunctional diguanylate cyclase/phosphodiesterase [Paraburkholderia sp. MPAMCS5]|uniref:putative bifunctional diguanylate cyclase/phosphodiesterase n=1 Tax=Paraburkholderia sp. MPAMCS5 TaxID=3112563 RepID=UPI002E19BB68|nr:bifunctional diguanylate cyclase/phosphodiesterase [Paraburkholderia sp. MPAMCS5]
MTQQVSMLPEGHSNADSKGVGNTGAASQSAANGVAGRASLLDSLTGVHNRTYASVRAQRMLRSESAARIAVLIVNLDGFSKINDVAGYDLGDRVLRSVAQRLAGSMAKGDLLARVGGDEFVIVADDRGEAAALAEFAQRVLELFAKPFVIAGREYRVSASMGVALSGADARDAAALMRDAGSAMRRAKQFGRGSLRFFTGAEQKAAQRRFRIEELLHHALAGGEFKLAYQAVVDAGSRETVAAEALLRWSSSELGDVAPSEFIPIAEEAGLMESIGDWVLEQACAQAADWRWSIAPDLGVSVNISPVQFNERLVRHVAACLERTGLEATALQLEITEGMLMPDDAALHDTTAALAQLGVKLAVDDFGTGYASLSYLKRFPLHSLKVDRSFVSGLPRDTDSAAITQALVEMAHACGMRVTAEGVETEAQAAVLLDMGCDALQGYLFNRPVSAAEFAGVLSRAGHANRQR